MREIKFRAWIEGRNGTMEYGVILSTKGNYCSVEAGWDIQGEYPNISVMQFTGLKDKNGLEIYDGDVLESNQLDANVRVNWSTIWACWECFGMSGTEDFGLLSNISLNNYLVIGNIYENPELLKNKEKE